MKLNKESINNKEWEEKGFITPKFDINLVKSNTEKNPRWVHFGIGNIFRAFPAVAAQSLIEQNLTDTGIIGIGRSFEEFDNLTIAVALKSDGEMESRIVASITQTLTREDNESEIKEIFLKDSLQMISLTITEKGYTDIKNDKSTLVFLCRLLYERFLNDKNNISIVSMDNLANNGDFLREVLIGISRKYDEEKFTEYVKNQAYPLTMIDKITPSPSPKVAKKLNQLGFLDTEIRVEGHGTSVSSFVNAEEIGYLVIEDIFPNGRPPLEKAGIIFTDRNTVTKIEKMKVGALLNPLHTIIAIFGSLLSIEFVYEAMENEALVSLIKHHSYREALHFVPDPKIINPKYFLDEVLEMRFKNPFIPDSPKRIATDTSLKIPIRFGEVLKVMQSNKKDFTTLRSIPFFIAGWFRYLTKINDRGEVTELSSDPNLQELTNIFEDCKLGEELPLDGISLLKRKDIFGINAIVLAPRVKQYFDEMNKEEGAVLKTINKYWGN